MSEYIVKTTVHGNSIVQESGWQYDASSNLRNDIVRRVVQLEDEGIKAALVKLGWTPPGDSALADAARELWVTFVHTSAYVPFQASVGLVESLQYMTQYLRGRNFRGMR
ncbi:MAG: hypothetical protein [Bacteriophage sp.]|nr:MAG: hypothetical protein [Bacteriophage sp.]